MRLACCFLVPRVFYQFWFVFGRALSAARVERVGERTGENVRKALARMDFGRFSERFSSFAEIALNRSRLRYFYISPLGLCVVCLFVKSVHQRLFMPNACVYPFKCL